MENFRSNASTDLKRVRTPEQIQQRPAVVFGSQELFIPVNFMEDVEPSATLLAGSDVGRLKISVHNRGQISVYLGQPETIDSAINVQYLSTDPYASHRTVVQTSGVHKLWPGEKWEGITNQGLAVRVHRSDSPVAFVVVQSLSQIMNAHLLVDIEGVTQ